MTSTDPRPVAATPRTDRIGVLLVDDHRMFGESLGRLLADEPDIEVLAIATTSKQALSMADALHPRVVLVDHQLPDQDGIWLAAELKRRDPERMIVMLTSSTDERVLRGALDAGCSGFLTKDLAAAEVAETVRVAARGEALISPAMLARLLPKLSPPGRSAGSDLTEREREILTLLADGRTNKAVAAELFLSVNTVRNHVQSILTKLGAHSKLEAVSIALREEIIKYPSQQLG
jgi:DNA-binding NarL/FixJ family response regulator